MSNTVYEIEADVVEYDLYVDELFKCQNCGRKDKLKSNYDVDKSATTDKIQDGPCSVCESEDWTKHAEIIKLAIPSDFSHPYDTINLPLDEVLETVRSFQVRLETANDNGFYITNATDEELILRKDIEDN